MQYSMIDPCVCLGGGVNGRGPEGGLTILATAGPLEGRKGQSVDLMTNCDVGGAVSESGR